MKTAPASAPRVHPGANSCAFAVSKTHYTRDGGCEPLRRASPRAEVRKRQVHGVVPMLSRAEAKRLLGREGVGMMGVSGPLDSLWKGFPRVKVNTY